MRAETSLLELLVVEGRVTGVRIRVEGRERILSATSVVLASGGFDAADDVRRRLLPTGLGVSASAPGDTGVALTVAEQWGLATDNLGEGWWMPMAQPDGDEVGGRPYPGGWCASGAPLARSWSTGRGGDS